MRILELLRHSFEVCKAISKKGHYSTLYYWMDYFYARMVYGCDSRQYDAYFYKLSREVRNDTLTWGRAHKCYAHFNKKTHIHFCNNKSDFNKYFSKYVGREWLLISETEYNVFYDFLKKEKEILVKPCEANKGEGIRKICFADIADTKALYDKLRKENVQVEGFVKPHPLMKFNAKCVNTIRVMSILDKNGKCDILKTILRVGVGDSIVDNYHAGGVIYSVDSETGIIDHPGQSRFKDGVLVQPLTDIVMVGQKLPNWDILLNVVKSAHESIPECRYIGWDVAITENGVVLIEANHDPDYELYESLGKNGFWRIIKERYW